MDITLEKFADCGFELARLIEGYYADTNAQEGIPPLNMDWVFYARLEVQDKLRIFTARDSGELQGFAMYMLMDHPQHRGMQCAMCNTLAVATKYRGRGTGRALVDAAIAFFNMTDVKMIVHGFRTIYDTTPLFEKMEGFKLVEKIYMRML